MVNYFTDIVGATQEAFERGRARSQGVRQQIGESRAARALASGNYAAAKEAYGRAGMAPQVEALNERQRGMEEAERRRQREAVMQGREDESYMREREEYARDIAKGQFEALGQYANALAQVPYEQRKAAWNGTLRPAVMAMGIPEQAIAQIDAADLNDQNLQMFMQAAGMEMEKLDAAKPSVTVSQRGATVYDPATGTARFIPAEGAPPEEAARAPAAPSGYRYRADGTLEPIPGGPADKPTAGPGEVTREVGTAAANLRKEFNARAEVKDYRAKTSTLKNMEQYAKAGTAASDMALIFAFMKMLDPTSTVREGEFATAQNAASIPERIRNQYNAARAGTRISEKQRDDFVNQARGVAATATQTYEAVRGEYETYARLQQIPSQLLFGATTPKVVSVEETE